MAVRLWCHLPSSGGRHTPPERRSEQLLVCLQQFTHAAEFREDDDCKEGTKKENAGRTSSGLTR